MVAQDDAEADTRHRVLESATRLFAEKGFRETTVHDICDEAEANIAAVNYYFGSKENLYEAAWRHAYQQTGEARTHALDPASGLSPEEQIRAFVHARLDDVSSEGPASYFWRILEKEHHDPTGVHETVIHEVFMPLGLRLEQLILQMLDGRGSELLLKLCTLNLIAQLGFLTAHRPIIRRVFGRDALRPPDADLIYDHVMRFFLAGVRETRRALDGGRIAEALAQPTANAGVIHI